MCRRGIIIVLFGMLMLLPISIHSDTVGNPIKIVFTNEEEKPVKAIRIQIQNEGAKKTATYTSNEQGEIVLDVLPVGTYYMTLQKADGYDLQKVIDFEITPYTYEHGFTLHIVLHSTKETGTSFDSSLVVLFGLLVVGSITTFAYFFRKKTFTQFLDDFMI